MPLSPELMARSRSPRRGAVLPQVVLVARDRDAAGSAAAGTAAAGSAGAPVRAKAQQLSVAGEVVLENLLGAAAASRAAAAAAAGPAAGSAAVPAAGSRAVPAAGGGKGGGGKGGGKSSGGNAGSGRDWDYDEATRTYRKRWPTRYCVSWFDEDYGCNRPAIWTLEDLEFPTLSGKVHVEEVWTWKWLDGI